MGNGSGSGAIRFVPLAAKLAGGVVKFGAWASGRFPKDRAMSPAEITVEAQNGAHREAGLFLMGEILSPSAGRTLWEDG